MAMHSEKDRQQTYYHLSAQLVQIDNAQLSSLLDNSEPLTSWGRNQTIEIGGRQVFVKRIPMTDIEQANMFSTKNLYDLPPYYNYGIGSVGSGVFRELVTHIKTTNWVLSGEIDNFPLLYHYRVMPFSGEREEIDIEKHNEYVTYWGGSENIGRYMLDRANATAELLLFLEYIPDVLASHLLEHAEEMDQKLAGLRTIIDFLRHKGIIHFDAHFWNVLMDDERLYLTDFGLLLDKSFALSADEQTFCAANTHYDYGRILVDLIMGVFTMYRNLSEEAQKQLRMQFGVPDEKDKFDKLIVALFTNIEEIAAKGLIEIDEVFLACIVRHRSIIALMVDFLSEISGGSQKDVAFPNAELRRLLNATGFVAGVHHGD